VGAKREIGFMMFLSFFGIATDSIRTLRDWALSAEPLGRGHS
jgi:hypothetical protein